MASATSSSASKKARTPALTPASDTFLLIGPDCSFEVQRKQISAHSYYLRKVIRGKDIRGVRLFAEGLTRRIAGAFAYYVANAPASKELATDKPLRNGELCDKNLTEILLILRDLDLNELAILSYLAAHYMIATLSDLCAIVGAEKIMKCAESMSPEDVWHMALEKKDDTARSKRMRRSKKKPASSSSASSSASSSSSTKDDTAVSARLRRSTRIPASSTSASSSASSSSISEDDLVSSARLRRSKRT